MGPGGLGPGPGFVKVLELGWRYRAEHNPSQAQGSKKSLGLLMGVDVGGRNLGLKEKNSYEDETNNNDFYSCSGHICYFFRPVSGSVPNI